MKKKKWLFVLIVLVMLSLTAATIGVLYLKTDVFKSEKQLFFESLSRIKILDTELLEKCNTLNQKKLSSNNLSKTNINFASSTANDETEISDIKNVFGLKINSLANNQLKQAFNDFTVKINDAEFIKFKTIKDDNLYGIILDNVLSKYIALENKNLKNFFTKLGIEDISQIPNTVETNLNNIIEIDEETLKNIAEKYYVIFYNNIDESHFEKIINEDKSKELNLKLSEKELIEVFKIIIQTVKNDTGTLNFILSSVQNIESIKLTIEDIQTALQESLEILEKIECAEENSMIITIFENAEKIITKVEVQITQKDEEDGIININQYKIEFDISEIKKYIITLSCNNTEMEKIILSHNYDDTNMVINAEINNRNEKINLNSISMQYQISNYQTDNIESSIDVLIKVNESQNYQINYSNEFNIKQDIQIEKLTTENSAKLNNMTAEELQNLFTAIKKRINSLYGKQLENILPKSSIIERVRSAKKNLKKAQQEEQEMIERYQ